eukprot:gene22049-22008_t
MAMVELSAWLKAEKLNSKMIMQVHDEVIFEVPKGELELIQKRVPEIMTQVAKLRVPLEEGRVFVDVGDDDMFAYRAYPKGKKNAPIILVVPEIFGVHAYLEDVCRRFAQAGFYALAPEIFFRHSEPGQYATVAAILENVIAKMDDKQVMADLDKCVEFAGTEGADLQKLAVTGFCWGGRITWLYAAHQPAVKAGVAWYGRLVGAKTDLTPVHPVDVAAQLKAPVLGLYGSEDSSIPLDT